jgi:hypothetical protein
MAQTSTNWHKPAQTGTKKNRHKPAQTGTNRHKPAQTGTNRHKRAQFVCRRRGGAHLPPYDCLLLQSAASAHLPRGVGDRRLIGNARSGGRLAMGPCLGAYAVASIVPLSLASYSLLSLLSLQPHFLPFPLLLLATAPCPAPSCRHCVVVY